MTLPILHRATHATGRNSSSTPSSIAAHPASRPWPPDAPQTNRRQRGLQSASTWPTTPTAVSLPLVFPGRAPAVALVSCLSADSLSVQGLPTARRPTATTPTPTPSPARRPLPPAWAIRLQACLLLLLPRRAWLLRPACITRRRHKLIALQAAPTLMAAAARTTADCPLTPALASRRHPTCPAAST